MKSVINSCSSLYKKALYQPLLVDGFVLSLFLIFNPITLNFTSSPGHASPDSIAYVTLAEEILRAGRLYISSWGHIDDNLILPPIYPTLIALGKLIIPASLSIAEYISSISLLLTLILSYFLVKTFTNRYAACIANVLIASNYYFAYYGLRPLTEALFIFLVSLGLLLYWQAISMNKSLFKFFLIGILSGIIFLCKQVGLVFFLFIIFFFLIKTYIVSKRLHKEDVKKICFASIGFVIIVLPYSTTLFKQTGHSYFTQGYREYKYVRTATNPNVLNVISKIQESIKSERNYDQLLFKRTLMKTLLPDGSEILSALVLDEEKILKKDKSNVLSEFLKVAGVFQQVTVMPRRFINNIKHIISFLGPFLFSLFVVSLITPFLVKEEGQLDIERFYISSFVLLYMILISFWTDMVDRYINVIFPFIIIHTVIEIYILFMKFTFQKKLGIFILISFAIILFFLPQKLFDQSDIRFKDKSRYEKKKLSFVKNEEPIFSINPTLPYIHGGRYRTLPNDSLEKIRQYGKITNVRYIILDKSQSSSYNRALWMKSKNIQNHYSKLLRLIYRQNPIEMYKIKY